MSRPTSEERFWRFVAPPNQNGCRLWLGGVGSSGYGRFNLNMVDGKQPQTSAHRFAYEQAYGPIPEGMTIDHTCRTKLCVEAAHLEAVTSRENTIRHCQTITHCPQGHPYEGDNLVLKTNRLGNKQRVCRTCRNEGSRRAQAAKRKQAT